MTYVKAYEQKINGMNLIALRAHACPKVSSSNEWYMNCVGCKGLNNCVVGKRVQDILEKQTEPLDSVFEKAIKERDPVQWLIQHGYYSSKGSALNNLNRWKRERGNKTNKMKTEDNSMTKTTTDRDTIFRTALTQPDPIGYVQEALHYNLRHSASAILRNWKKKNGLLQESSIIMKNSDDNIADITKILSESKDLNELVIKFVETCNPITFIKSSAIKAYEWSKNPRYQHIENVSALYTVGKILSMRKFDELKTTDFLQKFRNVDIVDFYNKNNWRKQTVENIIFNQSSAPTENAEAKMNEEDEVSIEDFLNETETDISEPEKHFEIEEIQSAPVIVKVASDDVLFENFKTKYNELKKERERLHRAYGEVCTKMDALVKAAEILEYDLENE